jgi:TPR repeat protein
MKRSFTAVAMLAISGATVAVAIALLVELIATKSSSDRFDQGLAAYEAGSYARALEHLTPLAEAGDNRAQLLLGVIYEHGQDVPPDLRQAFAWYGKAADQGNAEAQVFVGIMYALGRGVVQDNEQAVQWFRKAANQGSARASGILGDTYSSGRGVQKDDATATDWYRKAAQLNLTLPER